MRSEVVQYEVVPHDYLDDAPLCVSNVRGTELGSVKRECRKFEILKENEQRRLPSKRIWRSKIFTGPPVKPEFGSKEML